MKNIMIVVEDYLYGFYKKIDKCAGDIKPEKVMADALLKLAGELSLNTLNKIKTPPSSNGIDFTEKQYLL